MLQFEEFIADYGSSDDPICPWEINIKLVVDDHVMIVLTPCLGADCTVPHCTVKPERCPFYDVIKECIHPDGEEYCPRDEMSEEDRRRIHCPSKDLQWRPS